MTTESLTTAALALPPESRAELVDTLLRSLESQDQETAQAWANEAEDRLAAYDRGEIRSHSREEVSEALGLRPKS